jgi:hypothetical protein
MQLGNQMFDTAAMGTVSQSNISEILREAGPQVSVFS